MRARWHDGVALLSGVLFGTGLLVSGMVDPAKVKGFLDITGQWDPSLGLVMAGAIAVALPVFQWRRRHLRDQVTTTVVTEPVTLAAETAAGIDRRLVIGSVLFGVGWGLSGLCPGPALVVASSGSAAALGYVLAMIGGAWLAKVLPLRGSAR